MTYISGNITSANPAADLYAQIDTALSSAGFTFVDTVVITTRTHKIWKSNAANNTANVDWYLDVTYTTTGTGSIWLGIFEDYNATTDIGYRGIVWDTTTTVEQTYFSKYGATGYALETNWTGATNTFNQIDLSTAAFGYWISITQNRIIAMTSLSATKLVYCGVWEPNTAHSTYAGAQVFPLIVGSLDTYLSSAAGTAATNAGVTRAPRAPSISRWTRAGVFWSGHSIANHPDGGYGAIGAGDVSPFLGAIQPRGKYIYVLLNQSAANSFSSDNAQYALNANAPANVGRAKDVLSFLAAATVTRGDTVTINGETWILTSKATSYYTALAFRAI